MPTLRKPRPCSFTFRERLRGILIPLVGSWPASLPGSLGDTGSLRRMVLGVGVVVGIVGDLVVLLGSQVVGVNGTIVRLRSRARDDGRLNMPFGVASGIAGGAEARIVLHIVFIDFVHDALVLFGSHVLHVDRMAVGLGAGSLLGTPPSPLSPSLDNGRSSLRFAMFSVSRSLLVNRELGVWMTGGFAAELAGFGTTQGLSQRPGLHHGIVVNFFVGAPSVQLGSRALDVAGTGVALRAVITVGFEDVAATTSVGLGDEVTGVHCAEVC
jgi:hypothetical protein